MPFDWDNGTSAERTDKSYFVSCQKTTSIVEYTHIHQSLSLVASAAINYLY